VKKTIAISVAIWALAGFATAHAEEWAKVILVEPGQDIDVTVRNNASESYTIPITGTGIAQGSRSSGEFEIAHEEVVVESGRSKGFIINWSEWNGVEDPDEVPTVLNLADIANPSYQIPDAWGAVVPITVTTSLPKVESVSISVTAQ